MTSRDLAILEDETQQRARDSAAANERLTRAGEVEVRRCIWGHSESGCWGSEHGEPCGLNRRELTEHVRIDPPYTASQLRSIQRVEWDSWFSKRRAGRTVP